MKRVRTTIVLPEEDVRLIKILAANYGLTMSEVVQQGIRQVSRSRKKLSQSKKAKMSGFLKLAGSLDLGGKEPPTREELYDRYFKEKSAR